MVTVDKFMDENLKGVIIMPWERLLLKQAIERTLHMFVSVVARFGNKLTGEDVPMIEKVITAIYTKETSNIGMDHEELKEILVRLLNDWLMEEGMKRIPIFTTLPENKDIALAYLEGEVERIWEDFKEKHSYNDTFINDVRGWFIDKGIDVKSFCHGEI